MIFFFKGTATPGIYTYGHTLSLHAALPIGPAGHPRPFRPAHALLSRADGHEGACRVRDRGPADRAALAAALPGHRRRARRDADRVRRTPLLPRSEEHTSELQSLMRSSYAVYCLKKNKKHHAHATLKS